MCDKQLMVSNGSCENASSCSTDNCDLCMLSGGTEKCFLCEAGLVVSTSVGSDGNIETKCI